ncbi:MAG: type I CRISPR-associated protein Cas7, partial [bacterium]|nr:type I CRISPR-associated protein Cas7 [bacterium]
ARVKSLKEKYKEESELFKKDKNGKPTKDFDTKRLLKKCIDVRLFGGISTEEGDAVNLTGAVQFALLNPSLNAVDLRTQQNTSVFVSKGGNKQGAIGTTTLVPYGLMQIHGWINPKSAEHTGLSIEDVLEMQKALWNSINDSNTRSKSNQNSLLMIEIVYKENFGKVYGVDRLIKIIPRDNRKGEQVRSIDDFDFDLTALLEIAKSEKIQEIKYYTELTFLKEKLVGDKFKSLTL